MPNEYRIPFDLANSGNLLERVLESILAFDQGDDWLPDPVFFADYSEETASKARLASTLGMGVLPVTGWETVEIPRAEGEPLPALALPLEARACLHCAIVLLAETIGDNLDRDQVFGFECLKAGKQLFSQPGEGLAEAWEEALVESLWEGRASVLDVVRFNHSMVRERLDDALRARGGSQDLVNFALRVFEHCPAGAPSVDDAHGFLYNFYLGPVDKALGSKDINFIRYRDEIFGFGPDACETIEAELLNYGLKATRHQLPNVEQLMGELEYELTYEDIEVEKLIEFGLGEIHLRYECHTWEDEYSCSTDNREVAYRKFGPAILMDRLWTPGGNAPIDGVDVLPVLRGLNEQRRMGRFWAVSVDGRVSPDLADYRAELAPYRARIGHALGVAVETRSDWQLSWTAPLLADLGRLTDQEIEVLITASQSRQLGGIGRQAARLALARSSTASSDMCWDGSESQLRGRALRTAILTAAFLGRRGDAGPLTSISEAARSHELGLWQLLNSERGV